MGALPGDVAYDSNWGHLRVVKLSTRPQSSECSIRNAELKVRMPRKEAQIAKCKTDTIKVRVKEMSAGHPGLTLQRAGMARLASQFPMLQDLPEGDWSAANGPLANVSLQVVRVLLHWSKSGVLQFAR